MAYRSCKNTQLPWHVFSGPATRTTGTVCESCKLHQTIRPNGSLSLDSHAENGFGPARRAWAFCIKVTLLQVHVARKEMSRSHPDFAEALFSACHVPWAATGGSPTSATDAALPSIATRTILLDLLDWGHDERPPSVDKVASWLTSGATLPNIVLFDPVLATACGLAF